MPGAEHCGCENGAYRTARVLFTDFGSQGSIQILTAFPIIYIYNYIYNSFTRIDSIKLMYFDSISLRE